MGADILVSVVVWVEIEYVEKGRERGLETCKVSIL